MKIALCIPTNRGVRPQTVLSLLQIQTEHTLIPLIETEGLTIEDNRNKLTERAIENEADYMLFIDDDMTFPPNIIEKLLSHDKMVVGVLSKSRTGSYTVKRDGIQGAVMPIKPFTCRAVGTGIMLINTKIFNELNKPYFLFKRDKLGKVTVGEDVYFCDMVRDAGHEVWCDPTIKVGHIGDKSYE